MIEEGEEVRKREWALHGASLLSSAVAACLPRPLFSSTCAVQLSLGYHKPRETAPGGPGMADLNVCVLEGEYNVPECSFGKLKVHHLAAGQCEYAAVCITVR